MHFLKQASRRLRLIRLERFLGSLIYPLQREWLEYQARKIPGFEAIELPGNVYKAESTLQGGCFNFGHLGLVLDFLASDFVRIHWTPGKIPVPYAIAKFNWEPVEVNFEEREDHWLLWSEALQVLVYQDARLEFRDRNGQILRQERSPERSTSLHSAISTSNQSGNQSGNQSEGWIHEAELRAEEKIYGLGERAALLNLRTSPSEAEPPKNYRMWNYDAGGRYGPGTDPLYLGIPVYMGLHSQGSYLGFYENSYPATFNFKEITAATFEGGALDKECPK